MMFRRSVLGNSSPDLDQLRVNLTRLRGNADLAPEASIIIPINAKEDLGTSLRLVGDICQYRGRHTLEIIPVINNFPPDAPPAEIETFRGIGLNVVPVANIMSLSGKVRFRVSFRARVLGSEASNSPVNIHFDADTRLPDSTAVLDWYIGQLSRGVQLAYSHVGYYEVYRGLSIRARLALHHAMRWVKRNLLKIPTARGSNYAIDRGLFLRLFENGCVGEDLQVGMAVKRDGGRSRYSGASARQVLTSGRRFSPGWKKVIYYNVYRLRYNLARIRATPGADALMQTAVSLRAAHAISVGDRVTG